MAVRKGPIVAKHTAIASPFSLCQHSMPTRKHTANLSTLDGNFSQQKCKLGTFCFVFESDVPICDPRRCGTLDWHRSGTLDTYVGHPFSHKRSSIRGWIRFIRSPCTLQILPQPKSQPNRPTGYGDMALLRKFAKNNEKCSISVTHGPIGPKFWLWQYLQGTGWPYEANSSSNRTPSMRKWVSHICVTCPTSVSV